MSIIAEDQKMLKRADKYLCKHFAVKEDSTRMTKKELFAKIDCAYKRPGKSFESVEELDKYIRILCANMRKYLRKRLQLPCSSKFTPIY